MIAIESKLGIDSILVLKETFFVGFSKDDG
jgi:hypothetical protein